MAKGDDAIAKNRNKAIRKRNRRVGADSIEAIQGVQAAKRRRKAGTRRACEGMCYTLPTPDDPFLDRRDRKLQMDKKREAARKAASLEPVSFVEKIGYNGKEYQGGEDAGDSDGDVNAGYDKQLKRKRGKEAPADADEAVFPSKKRKVDSNGVGKQKLVGNGHMSLIDSSVSNGGIQLSVKSVDQEPTGIRRTSEGEDIKGEVTDEMVLAVLSETGLVGPDKSGSIKGSKSGSKFGNQVVEQFWKAYSRGVDVLATCSCSLEDRALGLVAPSAAHVKEHRVKHGALHQPLVLILVPSQDQALRVRSVLRPLKKALGITSVCLHSGTSLERQTDGLKSLSPDVLVATPDRLCELLSVHAIKLSSISLLVVDELSEIIEGGLQSQVSKIKEYVSRGARKIVLSKDYPERAVIIARQLVADPIARVTSNKSLESSSACITQIVSVFTNVNKRMSKMLKILQQFWDKQEKKRNWGILIVVESEETIQGVLPELKKIGYSSASLSNSAKQNIDATVKQIRDGTVQALVSTAEFIDHIPLENMMLVINYGFPQSMKVYEQILTGMAREYVDGVLHTFCTASMASSAAQLVQVLKMCLQEVPLALNMLAEAASLVQLGLAK
ncbi:hypothetical protein AXG93_1405s1040 [Marchantia polymorpha subsp. ruderalis]|uniref:RNA helicase n=1 Tax=Marchantia polymorpha subsp. ruderalis TaxID=1480154 RepID=A0A176VQF1_MARPO|nr:hypothetical protein AXG93_1405s1040 [Marchantia polymorpha subsp. ruderalis]